MRLQLALKRTLQSSMEDCYTSAKLGLFESVLNKSHYVPHYLGLSVNAHTGPCCSTKPLAENF